MFAENPIKRRQSTQIRVGNVLIGGDAPIAVQSMTNTRTTDVAATVAQIQAIAKAGADMVRALLRVGRRIDEIAAKLADINDGGRALIRRVVPEDSVN